MSKRDRRIMALIFAVVWVLLMPGVWWIGTTFAQASVGLALLASGVSPAPVLAEMQAQGVPMPFVWLTLGGLVLGCAWFRYGPEPSPRVPPPPPPYQAWGRQ